MSSNPPERVVTSRRQALGRSVMRLLHNWGLSRYKLRKNWIFSHFGDHVFHSDLWKFRRESVARAWLIGSISAASPFMGIQTWMVLPFNIVFRAHVPVTIAVVFLSNPFTAVPFYSFAFWLGTLITGFPVAEFDSLEGLAQFLWELFYSIFDWDLLFSKTWKHIVSLLVGCTTIGVVSGVVGYFAIKCLWHEQAES